MSDIFEEAERDYIEGRNVQLFRRLLPLVIGITIVIIIAMVIQNWREEKANKEAEVRTEMLLEAMTSSKPELASEAYKSLISAGIKDGIIELAEFQLVQQLLRNNEINAAVEKLALLINDGKISEVSKSLAKLQLVAIKLDQVNLSEEEQKKINKILESFNKTHPLYSESRIYHTLYNIKLGNKTAAESIINELLKSDNLSNVVRSQAEAIASAINQ